MEFNMHASNKNSTVHFEQNKTYQCHSALKSRHRLVSETLVEPKALFPYLSIILSALLKQIIYVYFMFFTKTFSKITRCFHF